MAALLLLGPAFGCHLKSLLQVAALPLPLLPKDGLPALGTRACCSQADGRTPALLAKELLLLSALVFQGGFLVCFPSDLCDRLLQYKPTSFLSSYLSLLTCRSFFCWALLWMGEGVKQGRGLREWRRAPWSTGSGPSLLSSDKLLLIGLDPPVREP